MDLFKKICKIGADLPDFLLFFISATIIASAGIYFLYALNLASVCLVIISVIACFLALKTRLFPSQALVENISNIKEKKSADFWLKSGVVIVYFLLFSAGMYLLYSSQSDRALISPWQLVPKLFFVVYIINSLLLAYILYARRFSATSKLFYISTHYFLSFSVAAIVYKIGYGFDPFIHQATMELIDKKGVVYPKPFYYLGEYGLIVVIHKLSGLSIYLLNKFLVPVLAAIFLPLSIYRLTTNNLKVASRILTPLFLLVLSFSPFIATTPQNLSYLFLILTITYGVSRKSTLWTLILALATLAIHPLTGIPAVAWYLILLITRNKNKIEPRLRVLLKSGLWFASALILPITLFISGGSDLKKITWNLQFIAEPIKNLFVTLSTAGQENFLLNFIYFFSYNYNLWLILIIAGSLYIFSHHIDRPEFKSIIFINSALAVAFILSSQILFTDLINYEQANFAGRLLVLITIFFLPIIISALQHLISRVLEQSLGIKIIWLLFGLLFIGTSLYFSYPRFDKYFNSRGYSTSANDLKAVRAINEGASENYVVLANQQVSVAALKELGFDHYYKTAQGLLYFYPIPTGGNLYQYYLDMVYKNPSRETMAKARELAGVNESYLVVNKYWFQSARVINAAKLSADSWQEINNEVYIFKYLP